VDGKRRYEVPAGDELGDGDGVAVGVGLGDGDGLNPFADRKSSHSPIVAL
jgi:hypothetical protein